MTKRFKDFWSDYGMIVIVAIVLLAVVVCTICLDDGATVSDTDTAIITNIIQQGLIIR